MSPSDLAATGTRSGEPRLRRIFVRDLVLQARIGVYTYEHHLTQRVRINLDLGVADDAAAERDALSDEAHQCLLAATQRLVAEGHVNLVETLAERLAELCLAQPGARAVRVRVEKLDVFDNVGSVGVEIERFKSRPLGADIEWFNDQR